MTILRKKRQKTTNQQLLCLLLLTVSGILSSATQYTQNYYLHYDYIGKEDQNQFLLCSNLQCPSG